MPKIKKEEIHKRFKEKGAKIISNYEGARIPVECICSCGHTRKISLNSLQKCNGDVLCLKCSHKRQVRRRTGVKSEVTDKVIRAVYKRSYDRILKRFKNANEYNEYKLIHIDVENKKIKYKTKKCNTTTETKFSYYRSRPYCNCLRCVKERKEKRNLEVYGVKHTAQLESTIDKMKQTNLDRYGVLYSQQNKEILQKSKNSMLKKYGKEYLSQTDYWKEKYKNTCLKKYGTVNPMKEKSILAKAIKVKLDNFSFNKSSIEDRIYEELIKKHKVTRQYKTEKYPYYCDFYIEDLDLYVEVNAYWTHGRMAFFENQCKDKLSRWKTKQESKFYKSAIKNWTGLDVRKRNLAKQNNLRYLELFDFKNIDQQIDRCLNGLKYTYTKKEIDKELKMIEKSEGNLTSKPSHNKIVLTYQDSFYRKENEIYKTDPSTRRYIIQNRVKYLKKKEYELTDKEILRGFKISGKHYGYSHFSPLWIKWFIEKYKPTAIYDFCGGWGHRMLGTGDIEYHYNDIDKDKFEAVKRISKDFNLKNNYFYNNPSEEFKPNFKYDTVFTCPPYYKTEKYNTCINLTYEKWIKEWWGDTLKNTLHSNLKYFAFVVNSDIKYDMVDEITNNHKVKKIDTFNIYNSKSHLTKTKNKKEELTILTLKY